MSTHPDSASLFGPASEAAHISAPKRMLITLFDVLDKPHRVEVSQQDYEAFMKRERLMFERRATIAGEQHDPADIRGLGLLLANSTLSSGPHPCPSTALPRHVGSSGVQEDTSSPSPSNGAPGHLAEE